MPDLSSAAVAVSRLRFMILVKSVIYVRRAMQPRWPSSCSTSRLAASTLPGAAVEGLMKSCAFVITGCLVLAAAGVAAGEPGQGRGKRQHTSEASSGVHGLSIVFSTGDVQIIRQHYAPRYRNLPKGLQKKLARTGQLPPGWQKKMEPLPVALERQLVVLPAGYRRGVIDGHAVIYSPNRGVIVDATVVF